MDMFCKSVQLQLVAASTCRQWWASHRVYVMSYSLSFFSEIFVHSCMRHKYPLFPVRWCLVLWVSLYWCHLCGTAFLVTMLCTGKRAILTVPHSFLVQRIIKLFSCAIGTLAICLLPSYFLSFYTYVEKESSVTVYSFHTTVQTRPDGKKEDKTSAINCCFYPWDIYK